MRHLYKHHDYVRKHDLRHIVFVGCHNDFIKKGVLEPDWVYSTAERTLRILEVNEDKPKSDEDDEKNPDANKKGKKAEGYITVDNVEVEQADWKMSDGTYEIEDFTDEVGKALPEGAAIRLKNPYMTIVMKRCNPDAWRYFREHHYKDHRLNSSCANRCFVGLLKGTNELVAFTAACAEPGASRCKGQETKFVKLMEDRRNYKLDRTLKCYIVREHRTVVLPRFQGLGIGPKFSDAVGHYFAKLGIIFYSKSIHPTFGRYRDRSAYWGANRTNHKIDHGKKSYSHFWGGPKDREDEEEFERTRAIDTNAHDNPTDFVRRKKKRKRSPSSKGGAQKRQKKEVRPKVKFVPGPLGNIVSKQKSGAIFEGGEHEQKKKPLYRFVCYVKVKAEEAREEVSADEDFITYFYRSNPVDLAEAKDIGREFNDIMPTKDYKVWDDLALKKCCFRQRINVKKQLNPEIPLHDFTA